MKTLLQKKWMLIVAFLLTGWCANAQWTTVGTAGFTGGRADYISIAWGDGGNQLYVAYQDWQNSKKISVMRYNGTAWEYVGTAGFSVGEAKYIKLIMYGSVPVVAFRDDGNSGRVSAMRYNGTSWVYVGQTISPFAASYVSVSRVNDGLFVTYRDDATSNGYVKSNAYNATSSEAWTLIKNGNNDHFNGVAKPWFMSLAYPWLAYRNIDNNKLSLRYRDNAANTWNSQGDDLSSGLIDEVSAARDWLTYDAVIVAYADGTDNDRIYVKRFGTSPQDMGYATTGGAASITCLNGVNGTYVSFRDYANSQKISVRKHIGGASWQDVGTQGFSSGSIYMSDMCFDPSGNPVVAYYDITNNITEVKRYFPPAPEINVKQNTTAIPDGTGTFDFGSHLVSTNTDTVFTIENTGTASSTLSSFSIGGTDANQFSFQGTNPTSVTNGSSVTFKVRFTPTSAGAKTASVSFANQDSDENPYNFTITGTALAIPTVTTQATNGITAVSATGNGNITNLNSGGNATNRGIIYYPYTDSDKVIGDASVTDVSETGDFGTGSFTASFAGLSVNTRYNIRAHATNTAGISYSARADFWTLAYVPSAPTVNNPTATTLDVAVNVNGNPTSTEFAIQDSVTGTYVQANGTLSATAVWQTAATWGTKTVTGLTAGTSYYFRVKARNGGNTETAFGTSANGIPQAAPTVEYPAGTWTEIQPVGDVDKNWRPLSVSGDGGKMLAGVYAGRLYLSPDGGTNWSETGPTPFGNKDWRYASVSADGSKMASCVWGGRIYLSSDGGTSWSETGPTPLSDKSWASVSLSSNGNIVAAVIYSGRLYISNNGGVNWSESGPAPFADKYWQSVSVSADGSKMVAASVDGRIYKSTDGGANWSETGPTPFGDKSWRAVSVSSDGTAMLAGASRLYMSIDGGTNWSETGPSPMADKSWRTVSLSAEGDTMIAAANTGRLYISNDKGTSWSESGPIPFNDKGWTSVVLTSDGSKMFSCANPGRIYASSNEQLKVTEIAATTATGNGKIANLNGGGDATNRGVIYYPYTDTDKVIGEASVTNLSETGTYGIGAFTRSLTGLSVNTHYNLRAHATNTIGTGYSDRCDFWTLANVPSAPTVNNPTATTLDVAVNVNGNPAATEFAIQDSVTGTYVQANGTLSATAVWQTAATWGTKTVTGLTAGTSYYFRVKARNGDNVESAFGNSANGIPVAAPTVEFPTDIWTETQPAGNVDKKWQTAAISGDGNIMIAGVGVGTGRLYLSSNGGTNWTETQPAGDVNKFWVSVSVTPDGSKMLALALNGRLYKSINSGTNWTETQPAGNFNKNWISGAISSDGSKILAAVGGGRLYLSTNGGANWVETQPVGNNNNSWQSVSMSSDGSKMLVAANGFRLYKSTDGGTSWTETQPAGANNYQWNCVSVSADGNKMIAGMYAGRLYLSTNSGTNWQEIQPAGNSNKDWCSLSISSDGNKILAGSETNSTDGRLYFSTNGGTVWAETQPAGEASKDWRAVSISPDGNTMLAGAVNGRIYKSLNQTVKVTNIAATTATGHGKIANLNGGGNATNRGVIYYPYTNTDKVIGEASVTNSRQTGTYGTGAFTRSLTGLSVNTHYNLRAHATNSIGTGYSDRCDFWTLAKVPSPPFAGNATAVSLEVAVKPNGNPAATLFLIQDSVAGLYLQPDGSRTATLTWQTAAQWDTVLVSGLSTGVTYYFRVKAKNGNDTLTAWSLATGANTCSNPTNGGEIGSDQTICEGSIPDSLTSISGATNYGGTLEYKWQSSTQSNTAGFADISGADGLGYQPVAISDTTWYRRLARVDCKADWTGAAESNVVKISTAPRPIANAGADASIVEGATYTLTDASVENYTGVSWTTDGDGSFNNEISLNPVYTPGDNDIAAGTAELCLSAAPESPCVVDSTDCMTLTIWRHPEVEITSPVEKAVLYANPVTISGTATDADDNLSIIEVKLNGGNWQTATGTTNWTISLNLEPGKNTIEARAKDATNLYSDTASVAVTLSIQVINIPQGWSYISSYLEPTDPDVVNMWADIVGANHLSILTGVSGIYAPAPFYINTLGTWNVLKGYKVKMNAADELIVSGDSLTDKTVTFPVGVHLVPVLTNQTTGIDQVFDNPSNDINYMLDIYSNKVYWPNGIIYTLTELVPGKGYLANFKNPVTLSYPPLTNFTVDNATALPPAPGPWPIVRTSIYHLISVAAEAVSELQNADYLGAFDSQGNCVGYAAIEKTGKNLLLTVYGDEQITEENDGMPEGGMIFFRAFNSLENTDKELTATFNLTFPNADGLFATNGLTGISGFKELATGVGESDLGSSVQVYPNPATDELNISLKGSGVLEGIGTLITAEGKVVKAFGIVDNHTKLDVSDLQPGIYVLRIKSAENSITKRIVVQ